VHHSKVHVARSALIGWIVVEEDANVVLNYSDDGRFRGFIGKPGEGPGEVTAPANVAVDATDSIWISDVRGRVVVFGPDGAAGRTIVNPSIHAVDGFTPSGSPFSSLGQFGATPSEGIRRYLQVWTRNGQNALVAVGPGAENLLDGGEPVPLPVPIQSTSLNDSVFLTPGGWHTWLLKWSPSGEEAIIRGDAVWQALGLADEPERAEGQPVAVMKGAGHDLWLLGGIRRISVAGEVALRDSVAKDASLDPRSPKVQQSLKIANAVFDGVLLYVTVDGAAVTVSAAATFPEYPWGFVDARHYYTFQELDNGLIHIRIWEFQRRCL
jgi:hypothetical protein